MAKNASEAHLEAWTLDQLAKSAFFHRKLHEWKLLEIATSINNVQGEHLHWENLNISELAWKRIIHRGIKPVIVFAHPVVLQTIAGSTGYYRMLTMVSQKSMKRVGISLDSYESGKSMPDESTSLRISRHLNRIISVLIEADEEIDSREFDLWRGMAAGTQAQGSWQNNKGNSAEVAIRELILRRLQEQEKITGEEANQRTVDLGNHRMLVFADEPDIAIYQHELPQVAVEVKGGIDPAGVLERIGAALKSLRRTRDENPTSITVLIVQEVSLTSRAIEDLRINADVITFLFSASAILEDEDAREQFFTILEI